MSHFLRIIPSDASKIIIELYDASNSEEALNADFDDSRTMKSEMEDDDDKVLYPKIGKTEITIDKVLSNLLVNDVRISFTLLNYGNRSFLVSETFTPKTRMLTFLKMMKTSLRW